MKNLKDTQRIPWTATAWEWSLIAEALDIYITEHMDIIDTSNLTDFANEIEKVTGITAGPDPKNWGK